MSAPKHFWVEIHAERYPASEGTDVLRWSDRDISDPSTYQGGWKEGRVSRWGSIRRAISDPRGDYDVAEGDFEIADGDYYQRTRLGDEETAYYDGRDLIIRGVSEAGRATAAVPKTIVRAKISEAQATDGLGGRIRFHDVLGSKFGPLGLESTVGRPFRREVFPDIHRDYLDTERFIVPIIVGEDSDYGTVDENGDDAAKGKCPGIYGGKRRISSEQTVSTSSEGSTLLPPPPAPTEVSRSGAGGSKSWDYACCVRTIYGGRTTLGDFATFDDLPKDGSFSETNYIRLALAQYSAELQAQVEGIDLYVRPTGETAAAWRYMDAAGQMFDTYYEDNGDDSHHKTRNPPPSKNTAVVDTTSVVDGTTVVTKEYGLIVHAGHACHALHQVYGSSGGEDGEAVRVEWDLDAMRSSGELVDWNSALWPHGSDEFIDVTGTDGVVERFFGYYLRGPRLQHHIDGRVTIAANICGMTANGDGSGDLVDQAAYAWQLVACEWLIANDGAGYRSGAYAGVPDWADTVPMISTSLVAAAQAQTATWLGTTKGYLAGYTLTTPITKREWMRRQNVSFGWFQVSNEFCQAGLKFINTAGSPTTGTYLRERIDEVVRIGAPTDRTDLRFNRYTIQFDYDADAQEFRSDKEVFKSDRSFAQHKAWYDRSDELYFVRDAATARDVAGRQLALYERAPREIPIRLGRVGFDLTLLSQGLVTAYEGIGSAGYALRPVQIVDQVFDLKESEVDIVAWDMGRLLGGEFGVQGASDMQWGDATSNTNDWLDATTNTARWG